MSEHFWLTEEQMERLRPFFLKSRDKPLRYDKRRYKRRNRIEIMFGRLKDWRRVATRYDRCPKVFLSAIDRETFGGHPEREVAHLQRRGHAPISLPIPKTPPMIDLGQIIARPDGARCWRGSAMGAG